MSSSPTLPVFRFFCAPRPSLLVDRARRRFEAKGGVVMEFTSIDGVSVRPDGVALSTSPSAPPGGGSGAGEDGAAASQVILFFFLPHGRCRRAV